MAIKNGTHNLKVKQQFIRHMLDMFLKGRYDEAFIRDIGDFRYRVEVDYDFSKQSHHVKIVSQRDFMMSLLVAEDRLFEVDSKDDWFAYHLQRMEPMMDTMVFIEWFYTAIDDSDKRVFREHLCKEIENVAYIPPSVHSKHGLHYRSRYDDRKIAPDWMVRVKFKNGAERREIISNIYEDVGGWIAMLLMVVDNKELSINVHA